MKKILFLMVAALAVMGCSKDEDVKDEEYEIVAFFNTCLLYTSPSPRDS